MKTLLRHIQTVIAAVLVSTMALAGAIDVSGGYYSLAGNQSGMTGNKTITSGTWTWLGSGGDPNKTTISGGSIAINSTTPAFSFAVGTTGNTFVYFSGNDNIWHNYYGTWQFESTLANPVRFYAPLAVNTGGTVTDSPTAPTINSGFGTTPSITSTGGTSSFRVTVGNPTGASGVLTMPAAANGWNCWCDDMTTHSATVFRCRQTASTTTSVTLGNFNNTPASANWVAADVLLVKCRAY